MTHLNRILRVWIIVQVDSVEQIFAESWNNPRLVIIVTLPHHSVALTSPCLSIREDTNIVT